MASNDSPTVDEPLGMQNTALRALAVVAILAMIVFWAWILTGGPKKTNPDYLDDRTFVTFANGRCQQLRDDLATLPNSISEPNAKARADTLDKANAMLSEMLDDLEAKAPTTGDDGLSLKGWFKDWRTYEKDRQNYAALLRKDPTAQMTVSENEELRDGVDDAIRTFADVNDMRDCRVPGDVG